AYRSETLLSLRWWKKDRCPSLLSPAWKERELCAHPNKNRSQLRFSYALARVWRAAWPARPPLHWCKTSALANSEYPKGLSQVHRSPTAQAQQSWGRTV